MLVPLLQQNQQLPQVQQPPIVFKGGDSGGGSGRRDVKYWLHKNQDARAAVLRYLTEKRPAQKVRKAIERISAERAPEDTFKPFRISAEKLAKAIIPERLEALSGVVPLDMFPVIVRALEIMRERDDEEAILLLM